MKKQKSGFTLIELLVVIAILGVLATLVLPNLMKGKKSADMLACLNNFRGLHAGMLQYSDQFNTYPRGSAYMGSNFWEALRKEPTPDTSVFKTTNDKIFVCPLSGNQPGASTCDYRGPNYLVSPAVDDNEPIGADEPANHDPANQKEPINDLLFGGSVKRVTPGTSLWNDANNKTVLKSAK